MEFKKFRRTGLSEMIPVKQFHGNIDNVSVSAPDKELPKDVFMQGFIARNPKNHDDMWYVSKNYFDENLEEDHGPEQEQNDSPGPFGLLHLGRGDFGRAVKAAKAGMKVARTGWNGSGMYAYIVPAASYPAQTDVAKAEFGGMVPYRAYWALKTAQGDVATWAPSGSDSLAEDWIIVN